MEEFKYQLEKLNLESKDILIVKTPDRKVNPQLVHDIEALKDILATAQKEPAALVTIPSSYSIDKNGRKQLHDILMDGCRIEIDYEEIAIYDKNNKKVVSWREKEWIKDPDAVVGIATAILMLHSEGLEKVKNWAGK